jgi:hypothetical protein
MLLRHVTDVTREPARRTGLTPAGRSRSALPRPLAVRVIRACRIERQGLGKAG